MAQSDSPPAYEPAIRTIAMPRDANFSGDIFGGWILSQMDLAGGSVAFERAKGRVATVAVESLTFLVPVAIGDEVSCYAEVVRVGRTSISTRVEVWTRRRAGEGRKRVTEGFFTYVAIDENRRPRPVDR
jgi:acyl-CoA thioesterase YciA